ncbi:MAG: GFA family protein [Roseofilum sp. SBFL]|uniref:GFA family protein n=1 Tax=unclassified Roseofilum TaxID=2620099 RepID=UPI001B040963|nr:MULTISPECIES: GFA family protein [unclassified Roseofilum]MBP0013513.1 GFA family protein [Roseofilum sp. SID3]MBP0025453.1 GFA family protein [Roseofilum sp. SID2]MBP0039687.1 GFA family protein [Roseofilum sp. SID1]MBP0042764.1 GFA family protein [Roseofilum sp. SBFL]
MVKGSCLCGQIEYEVELIPEKTFNCHCSFCRKAHGSAFATLTFGKGDTLKITKGENLLKEHKNDLGGFRAFCSNCGTRLMNYTQDKSIYLSIALSTVETYIDFRPSAHVNVESKATWHNPYEGIPSFQQLPNGIL